MVRYEYSDKFGRTSVISFKDEKKIQIREIEVKSALKPTFFSNEIFIYYWSRDVF